MNRAMTSGWTRLSTADTSISAASSATLARCTTRYSRSSAHSWRSGTIAVPPGIPPHLMDKVRFGLYGTGHSHAPGKLRALLDSPDVEFVGVCEDDPQLRERARANSVYAGLRFVDSAEELLEDSAVDALCVEGTEGYCAQDAFRAVQAGKHIWYDKPAGGWTLFQAICQTAREKSLHVQMGYMLLYTAAFRHIANWGGAGLLGDLFSIRGHMSTSSTEDTRGRGGYTGGIAHQLAPHMMDQVLWLFRERPHTVTSFLRN